MFRNLLGLAAVLAISVSYSAPVAAQSGAGAYLAGRYAGVQSDFREAARYYTQALARDPDNVALMESTALSFLSLGQIDKALPLARMLEETGHGSQIAHLVMTAHLAQQEDFADLLNRETDDSGIGPWIDGLVKAWAQMGRGDVTAAMAAFDTLTEKPGMRGIVLYHKASALASVGDYEGAEAIFGAEEAGAANQTRRGVMARIEILALLDRRADALEVLQDGFGDARDPEIDQLVAALEGDGAIPITHVRNAKDGIAEVFFTIAAVLKNEAAADHYVLLFSQIAHYLRPGHVDALLLSAGLLENLRQYDLAIEEYKSIPSDSATYHAAELGRADALRRAGKVDQAIEVLEQLARSHGDLPVVYSTLGDILRGKDDFANAIVAYDKAIELSTDATRMRWLLYYSRGIARERSGQGEASEKDFRAALALNPEQPQVLNYLGYSLVEQKRNLDEALDMIERAVAASPNSGYIVDSLGWVLYRLGRYDEALVQMERAVELIAVDPVVNDHLGDVYWAVGRHREAEFQWHRALSFIDADKDDTEADPDRIRRKIEVGLDLVLEEEGAPPLHVPNGN